MHDLGCFFDDSRYLALKLVVYGPFKAISSKWSSGRRKMIMPPP